MSSSETAGAETAANAAADVLGDFIVEFGRLSMTYEVTDRRNGTNAHDFGKRAAQAAGAVRRARQKSRLTWRHMLAERYWAVLAESGRDDLRRQLISLAAHALLWAAALDRRGAATTNDQQRAEPVGGDE